jgi:hypothetical protein
MSGLAAGIQRSDVESSYVVGVAYEMSSLDQQRLDEIERGGYRSQRVEIKVGGVHREGYTHVPVQTVPEVVNEVPRSYLEVMISGPKRMTLRISLRNFEILHHFFVTEILHLISGQGARTLARDGGIAC